jgi:PilZ domain
MRPSENPPAIPRLAIPPQRQRRHRRFNLQFPVSLSFSSHDGVREINAVSANISIGGVLLKAADVVPPHTQVSLVMEVKGPWSHRPVRLVAKGEVVRVENLGADGGFAIAIQCRQPIAEMKGRLAVAS